MMANGLNFKFQEKAQHFQTMGSTPSTTIGSDGGGISGGRISGCGAPVQFGFGYVLARSESLRFKKFGSEFQVIELSLRKLSPSRN